MGAGLSKLWQFVFGSNSKQKVLIVGLDGAGKTTITYQLAFGVAPMATPTLGSNVEQVKHAGANLEVWDVGGQESMRPTWPSFVPNARVLVLVIDSSDRARLPLAKAELRNLLERSELENAILLVLANKQDLEHAMSQEEVEEGLGMDIVKREWCVHLCSALRNEGLQEAFTWVANRLKASA